MNNATNLLVVDALNLAFRWKHSGATVFAEDYIRTVESLKKSYKAKWVIITADQGSSTYRKHLYPDYKQNRKDKYEQQTAEEQAAFEAFFTEFNRTLELLMEEYPLLRFPGVEADDIAAYIVSQHHKLDCEHTWLISSDKDWDLLVKPKVSRFSYVTRRESTQENWHIVHDFEPEDYISIKCLTGDTGDNIPGVEGIGPKRAQQLIKQWGSTWDIIANIPLPGKYKYIQQLNQSKELLELNYKLMDIETHCVEAIGLENKQKIDNMLGALNGTL